MEPLDNDWMELFENNVDAHERNHRDQQRQVELTPMLMDAVKLRLMDTFDLAEWVSDAAEVRGTWPKEYADDHR